MKRVFAEVRCPKCGRMFMPQHYGQKYCYNPCVPKNPNEDMASGDKVQRDCIMFHADGGREWCSGLNALYCGFGECRFYKQKEKKK